MPPAFGISRLPLDVKMAVFPMVLITRGEPLPLPSAPFTHRSRTPRSLRAAAHFQVSKPRIGQNRFTRRALPRESKSGHYGVHSDTPGGRESRRNAEVWFSTRGPSAHPALPRAIGSTDPSPGLLLLRRLEAYHRQFADRVELFRHWHMLVFASDARSLVTGDRVGNPLGHIAG